MLPLNTYNTKLQSNWCPGCGNFGILMALKKALAELNLPPEKVLIVSGIGCSSEFIFWMNTYGFQSIHGRILPVATAAHLCNTDLTVICIGGDGDGYGIGLNHAVHTMRRNMNLTYLTLNNQLYALTKGQTSPTSVKGKVSPSTPFGVIDEPIFPMRLGISSGATFVAQTFSGNMAHMQPIIKEGIKHQGFSLIDIFQPCVSFNKNYSYKYFQERCYDIKQDKKYNAKNKTQAFAKSLEPFDTKIPIGVLYQEKKKPFHKYLTQIKDTPLWKQDIKHDIDELLETFV